MGRCLGLLPWVPWVLCACADLAPEGAEKVVAEPQSTQTARAGPRPQPKPGERVRQPELDGYCAEAQRPEAFYYHGGRPVVRLAHEDGCSALFLSECTHGGECKPSREQEPGMWCCASAAAEAQARR